MELRRSYYGAMSSDSAAHTIAITTASSPSDPTKPNWEYLVDSIGGSLFVVGVVQRASQAIMEIYNRSSVREQTKEDGSPVSQADLAAAALIEMELKATGVPVVCEETVTAETSSSALFWLVDPLDGTKEFLAKNGEFTVNVALVCEGSPVLGVIGIPVTGEVYVGVKGRGAYRQVGNIASPITNSRAERELIAAVSRSHGSDAGDAWLEGLGIRERIQCGSAIKFCRVAEGKADLYVRFGRTMEWDTAAGHCVLEESGCELIVAETGQPLRYGKPGFDNPHFVACRRGLNLPLAAPKQRE